MDPFTYIAHPARITFGQGSLSRAAEEAAALGMTSIVVITTPEQAGDGARLLDRLGPLGLLHLPVARMHTPVEVTTEAMRRCRAAGVNGIVSLGGGSTIGLGKALSFRLGLPHLAIPSTYAGSEVTPVLGETENGTKTTLSDPVLRPDAVLYDPTLTATLPFAMKVTSGFNAIAHAVEATYSPDRNPVIDLMAAEGIRAITSGLSDLWTRPDGEGDAQDRLLYGAWLCGTCLGAVGMSLHHKLCHAIGGRFALNHAAMHTAILPHAAGFCLAAAPGAQALLCRALDTDWPAQRLFALARDFGAEMSLARLGMPEDSAEEIANCVLSAPYHAPRAITREALIPLLESAMAGAPPRG